MEQPEKQEVEEIKEETPEQPSEQEPIITGEVTLSFFKTFKKITGLAVEEENVPSPETEIPSTNDAPPENSDKPEEKGVLLLYVQGRISDEDAPQVLFQLWYQTETELVTL